MSYFRAGDRVPKTDPTYEILQQVGRGGFGVVYKAKHIASEDIVAIKYIPWSILKDEGKRVLREILILQHLRHPHLMCCLDLFAIPFEVQQSPNTAPIMVGVKSPFDTCIVMPFVPRTLCERNNQDYSTPDVTLNEQRFVSHLYYLLRGLDYYHKCGLVHRDLGPRNVLISDLNTHQPELYIADFGMARERQEGLADQTFYVTTRPYRAPELITARKQYTSSIDIWAIGCIAAEMLTGTRLFNIPSARDGHGRWSGTKAAEQLTAILKLIGAPSKEDVALEPDPNVRRFLESLDPGKFPAGELARVLRCQSRANLRPEAVDAITDLVIRCCTFTSSKRPTASELLESVSLFAENNLMLPPLPGTPCSLPDLAAEPMERVIAKILAMCRSAKYSPFVVHGTTTKAIEYANRLGSWSSVATCREVFSDITNEIMRLDDEMGNEALSEEERKAIEIAVYELLEIRQKLERFGDDQMRERKHSSPPMSEEVVEVQGFQSPRESDLEELVGATATGTEGNEQ